MKVLIDGLNSLLDAYGALFLARQRVVGALLLAATLSDPETGLCGLLAGVSALLTRALLRLPGMAGEAEILNAIYAGLALGAFYGGPPRTLALAAFGGLLAVPLATALRQMLAGPFGARGLPLLGAPFLVTAWTLLAVAKTIGLPLRSLWPVWPVFPDWLPAASATALAHVGALFFVANPLAGVLVLAAVLLTSPLLALLAIAGGLLASGVLSVASSSPTSSLAMLGVFNGALVAIFVGGTLAVPGRRTLLLAAGAVLVASALSAGMFALSIVLGVPPLSAPFVLTVWLASAALRAESSFFWARFWLSVPASPEDSMVNARLARARGLAAGSVALLPPYAGRMAVSQAVDGPHTHRGEWRYALDFVRLVDGQSYRRDGARLNDFHAFDEPVLSPADGYVTACRGDIADNRPGEMNSLENWGNHVLIDIGAGLYVLLAHLRRGSIKVEPGQRVAPGALLGHCGNSGRSAQPHLHLHVQRGPRLGSPTLPFHLAHCLIDGREYALDGHPQEGQSVEAVLNDPSMAAACAPRAGREWLFEERANEWRLAAEVGLLGETSLLSSGGGRVQANSARSLLALHQRRGSPDRLLDAFVLAFGMTPFAAQALQWGDAPDASLLPLPLALRLARRLRHPFGGNLESACERSWDPTRRLWCQRSRHRLTTALGEVDGESIGWLSEACGPVAFSLVVDGQTIVDAALVGYGNRGDHGVPAWSAAYPQTSMS
ncbi:urea transporter [Candidatus Accumulibacter sp. ACC003]|uniref:urea transporter n=1 Tax=Candidatus Accumulibacter sp. ACC003 TaxID=2823334 RepID=UPI0025B95EDE|nr:urea transporter [Candidatus Accumulibacter sp. ACC003]